MREDNHEAKDFADVCEALPVVKLKLKKGDLTTLADMQKHEVINYKMYL